MALAEQHKNFPPTDANEIVDEIPKTTSGKHKFEVLQGEKGKRGKLLEGMTETERTEWEELKKLQAERAKKERVEFPQKNKEREARESILKVRAYGDALQRIKAGSTAEEDWRILDENKEYWQADKNQIEINKLKHKIANAKTISLLNILGSKNRERKL